VQPRIDTDPETLPCVKVALPITASVSFRQVCADGGEDEEWRSIATETGPRRRELLQLAALPVDDSPTDVMTRRWWEAHIDVWEPPVPIVPQLPLELLMRSRAAPVVARPARRDTDWRSAFAPLSLLLAALSLVPPVGTAPQSPGRARTHSVAAHVADITPPPVVASAPAAHVGAVAPPPTITVAVQRRAPPVRALRRSAPRASTQLVRDVPF
jgi:hypothetical protein